MTSQQAGNTIDIAVHVVHNPDGTYSASCQTPIPVSGPTTINFNLDTILRVGLTGLKLPWDCGLGPFTVARGGRQISMEDPCAVAKTINFSIELADDAGVGFSHDPEVINTPR